MKLRFGQSVLSLLILLSLVLAGCAPAAQPTPAAATPIPPAATSPAPAPTQAPAAPTQPPAPTEVPTAAMAEPVTLNIMHNYSKDDSHGPVLSQVIDDFMKANPDIKIATEIYTDTDIPIKVETAFLANQEPDIVFNNYAASIQTWIDKGVTIGVDDLITQWGFDGKFLPAAVDKARDPKGRLVAFPFEGFTWPVWYNTDIFKKAGVEIPKTTDDLIEAAKKIRAAGYEPFTVGGSDWSGYAVFTSIVQLKLTDAEMIEVFGKGGFAKSQNAMDGIKLFTQLRDAGVFAKNAEGLQADAMTAQFFSEKAAMMQAGSWSFADLPAAMQNHVALGGIPISVGSPHEKPVIYAGFGKGVWITRNGAKKLDTVKRFIQYLYSPEVIGEFVSKTGMASPLLEVKMDPATLSPILKTASDYVKDVTVIDITDTYVPPKAFDALYKASADAFIPGTTPEKIAAEFDKIYTEQ